IDAVGLEDSSGRLFWASAARASSSYGVGNVVDGVTPVLPYWSGLHPMPSDLLSGEIKVEDRIIERRGWPMAAVRGEVMSPALPARFTSFIWFGLIVDTLIFATIAAAMWWLSTCPAKFLVESSRLRRGCCMRCGYELHYNF